MFFYSVWCTIYILNVKKTNYDACLLQTKIDSDPHHFMNKFKERIFPGN